MPIHTRFGSEVKIVQYVGFDSGHAPFGGEAMNGEWVRVEFTETGKRRDMLISDLRAPGGYDEILEAIDAVR